MKIFRYMLIPILIITLLLASGCKKEGYTYIEGKINIVATTTMLGDLAKEIGGENVVVRTLMNSGVDPHQYQTKASDTKGLLMADLIVVNGLHLEGQMGYVLEKLDPKRVIAVASFMEPSKLLYLEDGVVDPHIWFDVKLWSNAAIVLRNKLISLDKANEENYLNNTNNYLMELTKLDEYVINKANELPKEKRILVTAHDAFNYFGRAYGFEVYSIQGISTETEASVTDIRDLARLIKDLDVKAIFVESSIPEATIRSVVDATKALGHHVEIGGELYSDSLGDKESDADTYIKTVKININLIVNALKDGGVK